MVETTVEASQAQGIGYHSICCLAAGRCRCARDKRQEKSQPAMNTKIQHRIAAELGHWMRTDWTFADVGAHWDAVEDYDAINEETYSYFRRFVDGLRLSNLPDGQHVLDLCARTGNGTLYFHQHGKVSSAVCADVSERMGEICQTRLRANGFENFTWLHLFDYPLPLSTASFDAILCFETVEHLPYPERLVSELGRVTKPGGTLILTTPNVLWEPVHALAAISGAHHSEGPHRFIRYQRLEQMVRDENAPLADAVAWSAPCADWSQNLTAQNPAPQTPASLIGVERCGWW